MQAYQSFDGRSIKDDSCKFTLSPLQSIASLKPILPDIQLNLYV